MNEMINVIQDALVHIGKEPCRMPRFLGPRLDHRLAFAEKMSHDLTMDVQALSRR